ncbi:MAG: hypothetical protein CMP65_02330 [Flavobacteriales bacterium]|nr:hypothetical protein [Flavobacteriales bacterium]|tara:strand:+ start:39130 stop:39888 length:759 start_codon:yes stop_codon:yes gene_type:complete
MIKKITIIGSGNIAHHLGVKLFNSGINIHQVLARNKKSGLKLASKINSIFINDIKKIEVSELILICVNDDNIYKIANQLPDIPVVHTSGNTSIEVFKNKKNSGVIYPVQTIRKNQRVNFKKIPICVEANNDLFQSKIINLCKLLSDKILVTSSEKRKKIHLSAVIASNFSNFCYTMSYNILKDNKINFDILHNLIIQTAKNCKLREPKLNQTGPAIRKDKTTIREHLASINDIHYKKIYKLLSENILKEHEK